METARLYKEANFNPRRLPAHLLATLPEAADCTAPSPTPPPRRADALLLDPQLGRPGAAAKRTAAPGSTGSRTSPRSAPAGAAQDVAEAAAWCARRLRRGSSQSACATCAVQQSTDRTVHSVQTGRRHVSARARMAGFFSLNVPGGARRAPADERRQRARRARQVCDVRRRRRRRRAPSGCRPIGRLTSAASATSMCSWSYVPKSKRKAQGGGAPAHYPAPPRRLRLARCAHASEVCGFRRRPGEGWWTRSWARWWRRRWAPAAPRAKGRREEVQREPQAEEELRN